MNKTIFTQHIRQFLVPELRPGDIVILDNLSSHKGAEAAELVAARGATLMFLPPYSPDLNPIEMAFSKFKHLLRIARERTRDALWNRIGEIVDLYPPAKCQNYFRHAGYATVRSQTALVAICEPWRGPFGTATSRKALYFHTNIS